MIGECIKEGIFVDFLRANGGEVVSILNQELTTEEYLAIMEKDAFERGHEDGLAAGFKKGMADGRAKGLADGHAKGLAEGREERNIELAARMKSKGMSAEEIADITGLSVGKIDALKAETLKE